MHAIIAIGAPFIPGWTDLSPFIAEAWLILTILAVLLTPFFGTRSNTPSALVTLAGCLAALVSLVIVGAGPGVAGEYLRGMLVADPFAMLWKVLLLVFVMGIVVMWSSTTSNTMRDGDGPEFFTLLLGATLGMSLMASTSNLLMLFLAVEMASLPSYVLAGFRKTHRLGAEASLKYVLFGAATSSIMAYGLSMLYGMYGTLQLAGATAANGQHVAGLAEMMAGGGGNATLLVIAVFGLLVGIGFKISMAPFHFWCPDVFEGASIDVSAFLSVASKGAALTLLLRVLMIVADAFGYHNSPQISLSAIAMIIGVLGALTATVGNTAAFVQTNIKRLLAYSSIAHAGYMLCALSLLVNNQDNRQTVAGVNLPAQAILVYLAVYLFMNLGAFTVAGLVFRQTGSENLADYAGLGRRSPVLAACMFCFMISLVGLPPFGGFVAKFNVMYCLGLNGGWWWWLVVAIGVNTIFSLFYYLRVVRAMYLTPSDAPAFVAQPVGTAVAIGSAAMLVVLLVGFSPLNRLAGQYSRLQAVGNSAVAKSPALPAETPAKMTAAAHP